MGNKSSVQWKKLGLCFLFAVIFVGVFVLYLELRPPQTENIIMWSSNSDYCFAVDAPYDGDTYKTGTYHFYQDNVNTPAKAKAWDIYVGYNPKGQTSKISDMEYMGIVGTYENKELTIDIPAGKYVYVKHRGGENFEGSLEVDYTPLKN